jgi:hypothetical protein
MTLEQALSDARATFPNYPEEIFHLWLDDRIRSNGWPPIGSEWDGFLFGKSISDWQTFTWHQEYLFLTECDLTETSFSLVLQITDAGVNGTNNLVSNYIPDVIERFNSCVEYIRSNNSTPGKILLLRCGRVYHVVDGNHRVAALLALQSQTSPFETIGPVLAWVAR